MSDVAATAKAAFFDVDGTIISTKSLISFARFLATDAGAPVQIASLGVFLRELSERYRAGRSRCALNRYYFSIFRGIDRGALERAARQWYGLVSQADGFYIRSALQDIDLFRSKGYRIVLVSGSFAPLLAPLRDRVPYDDMLCTVPECVASRYTGELIGGPCIGSAKRDAILKYALRYRLNLQDSWAFGDDDSDLDMLEAVGNGVRTETDESTMDTVFAA